MFYRRTCRGNRDRQVKKLAAQRGGAAKWSKLLACYGVGQARSLPHIARLLRVSRRNNVSRTPKCKLRQRRTSKVLWCRFLALLNRGTDALLLVPKLRFPRSSASPRRAAAQARFNCYDKRHGVTLGMRSRASWRCVPRRSLG